jgi:hypothetical protein
MVMGRVVVTEEEALRVMDKEVHKVEEEMGMAMGVAWEAMEMGKMAEDRLPEESVGLS